MDITKGDWLYNLCCWIGQLFVRPFVHYTVEGTERLPKNGPALIASNHMSNWDPLVTAMALRRWHPRFLAKESLWNSRIGNWFMNAVNMIPTRGVKSVTSMHRGVDFLRAGGRLLIYPEGTRSRDGRLYRGHRGAAVLYRDAQTADVAIPVVPVAVLRDAHFRWWHPWMHVQIIIGTPFHVSQTVDLQLVVDEIMTHIAALSHQESVDAYAPRRQK